MNEWISVKNQAASSKEEICKISPKLTLSIKISSEKRKTYRLRAGVGSSYNLLNVVAKAGSINEAKDILLNKVMGITSLWATNMHISVKGLELPIGE